MQQVLRGNSFHFTINKAFEKVIRNCRSVPRKGQDGTWISPEIQDAYIRLHLTGFAHSAEAWVGDELAGGLYGIRLGNVFFGESMFSTVKNASKFAFINYVQHLQNEKLGLIDCQVYTPHLERLGAKMIPRDEFTALLESYIG
jgi:leucyl/phenylalanyl-tRNA--protein transferase